MVDRNAEITDDKRITFRIGINLGDIIVDGDDIFGDGVNVAARLEALAEPGGICISRTVRDHIGDRLPYAFEDIGEQSVKNIAQPVHAYAIECGCGRFATASHYPVPDQFTRSAQPPAAGCSLGQSCRCDRHGDRGVVGLAERKYIRCTGSGVRSYWRATPAGHGG